MFWYAAGFLNLNQVMPSGNKKHSKELVVLHWAGGHG